MPEGFIPQTKEAEPKIDFIKFFREKLGSIPPLSEQDSEWESEGFQDLGIKKIKRKIPAVIIYDFGNINKLQLWITDPEKANSLHYIHEDVRRELDEFLKANNLNPKIGAISSYIIQDGEDKLYIFFDGVTAKGRRDDVSRGYDFGSEGIEKYEELMERYGIEKMMGQFSSTKTQGDTVSYGWRMENILDKDVIGRIRENEHLIEFAQKYQMTNHQFMRFRIRAISGSEGYKKEKKNLRYMVDLDTLAKEIVAQE